MIHLPYIYFFGIAQIVIILPKLFRPESFQFVKNKILILCLIFISAICFNYAANILGIKPIIFNNLAEVFWFAICPLLYLYTLSLLDRKFTLKASHLFYFTFSIYNLIQYVLLMFNIEVTFRILLQNPVLYLHAFLFAYLAHAFFFSLSAYKFIQRYIKYYKAQFSRSQIDIVWLRNYFFVFFIFNLMFIINLLVMIVTDSYRNTYEYILVLYYEIFIIVIAYKLSNKADFLRPFEIMNSYSNSALKGDDMEKYIQHIKQIMNEQKLFLNKNLSLKDLATHSNITENNLSQIFSQKLNSNFYDYVNQFRVLEAKQRLMNPDFKHFKIISIAEDSGFNSKASFYRIFKKECQMTPTEFIESLSSKSNN